MKRSGQHKEPSFLTESALHEAGKEGLLMVDNPGEILRNDRSKIFRYRKKGIKLSLLVLVLLSPTLFLLNPDAPEQTNPSPVPRRQPVVTETSPASPVDAPVSFRSENTPKKETQYDEPMPSPKSPEFVALKSPVTALSELSAPTEGHPDPRQPRILLSGKRVLPARTDNLSGTPAYQANKGEESLFLQSQPGESPVYDSLLTRLIAAVNREDWSMTEIHARSILDAYPGDPNGMFYLAEAKWQQGSFSKAEGLYKPLLTDKTFRETVLFRLAELSFWKGERAEGRRFLEEIIQSGGPNASSARKMIRENGY